MGLIIFWRHVLLRRIALNLQRISVSGLLHRYTSRCFLNDVIGLLQLIVKTIYLRLSLVEGIDQILGCDRCDL